MRLRILAIISIVGLVIGLLGCKDLLTKHNIDLKGVSHGKKLYNHDPKACTACHGINLDGNGPVPGCYDCHDALWSAEDHGLDRGGSMHKPGFFQAEANCSGCHMDGLTGSDYDTKYKRPGCTDCHGDLWTALSMHTNKISGFFHGPDPDIWDPKGNPTPGTGGCDDGNCHGNTLEGQGYAPSCYECHGARWLIADHTQEPGGIKHMPGLFDPDTNCVECHGADKQGGLGLDAGPSCYNCHGARWVFDTTPHTDSEGGYMHAVDKDRPFSTGCATAGCHGTDLTGGAGIDGGPSCYQCHGAKWDGW